VTIRELAERVRGIVGADVRIEWDPAKPDGTPRKLLDVARISALGWRPTVALDDGIRRAYADYLTTSG
jgi:GDP-L-fucose synthase